MNFDVIERKRIAKGWSVTKLCEMANIDRKTYYNMKANPGGATFSSVSRLVSALGLTAWERARVLQ